jgi:hypothetical protein
MQCQQTFLQELPGPEEMDLDCANRQGKDLRHLFVRHILEVAQNQDYTILRRQLPQLLAYHGLQVMSLDGSLCLLLSVHLFPPLFRLHGHLQGLFALVPFELPQTTVVGDAIEPGRKACLAAETRQLLPRRQERLLSALAGIIVVLQHAQGQIEDAALISLDKERKGILVPMLAGWYKLRVVLLGLQGVNTWESSLQAA